MELLPQQDRERTVVFVTDQDQQDTLAFDQTRKLVFPNAVRRLCSWHKIVKELLSIKGTKRTKGFREQQWQTIHTCLFYITSAVNTEEEARYVLKQVHSALASTEFRSRNGLGQTACEAISHWIQNSFETQLEHLAAHNFRGRRCFGVRTTTWSESENSSIKRHAAGVRPHMSLDRSAYALSQVEQQRLRKRKRKADHGATTAPVGNNSTMLSVEGCTRKGCEKLTEQYGLKDRLACMRNPRVETVVWVKGKKPSKYLFLVQHKIYYSVALRHTLHFTTLTCCCDVSGHQQLKENR